jgi:hypothetical protein
VYEYDVKRASLITFGLFIIVFTDSLTICFSIFTDYIQIYFQSFAPWHFLYFLPLPQGHGSLGLTFFLVGRITHSLTGFFSISSVSKTSIQSSSSNIIFLGSLFICGSLLSHALRITLPSFLEI